MKYVFSEGLRVNDVSAVGYVFPDALFRFFQEAAINHSDSIGFNHSRYLEDKRIWVLNRLAFKLHKPVKLYDSLEITTWSRGMQRFRGFRDFVITVDGEKAVTASSVWLYIDIERKRPAKIEDSIKDAYQPEEEQTNGTEIEDWTPEILSDKALTYNLQVRFMDFDINAHINNTLYPAYVYQAFTELYGKKDTFSEFAVEFSHEIPMGIKEVQVRIEEKADEFIFAVSSGDINNAVGKFKI
jgi:medium-chain acyl-[acyl-carrier-protein] hydrolase